MPVVCVCVCLLIIGSTLIFFFVLKQDLTLYLLNYVFILFKKKILKWKNLEEKKIKLIDI